MANPEDADAVQRKGKAKRREVPDIGRAVPEAQSDKYGGGDVQEDLLRSPTLEDLRSLRAQRYSGASSSSSSRVAHRPRMTSASNSRSSLSTSKASSRHRHRKGSSGRSSSESKTRRRRKSSSKSDDDTPIYVYGPPKTKERAPDIRISETRTLGRNNDSSDSDEESDSMSVISEEPESKPEPQEKKKVRVVYIKAERPKPTQQSPRRRSADEAHVSKESTRSAVKTVHRSNTTSSRRAPMSPLDKLKRTLTVHEPSSDVRPSLRRSHTTSSSNTASRPLYETSIHNSPNTKLSNFLGLGMFTSPQKPVDPPRLVECTACLSDDIPQNKSAKLKCGHRMCHSCLKRIFKLSITDPQHMPPKCCTAEHIPLKHVDKLFHNEFKLQWNKKFQEYTTKNRIYCPTRDCGEWIKPGSIHVENGRKVGKCSSCKTKVCCLCNGKWHGNKDCPKDEETNQLLETAKKAGWQRCYNCRALVELKEGCNHMTCRCNAEFCMICGAKWKSCNCPWFNYQTVELDRLNHMRVPGVFEHQLDPNGDPIIAPRPLRRPPRAYNEEMDARRQQELQDEDLARRLQVLGVDDDDDWNGNIGEIEGVGNAAGHFMNEFYGGGRGVRYVVNINRGRIGVGRDRVRERRREREREAAEEDDNTPPPPPLPPPPPEAEPQPEPHSEEEEESEQEDPEDIVIITAPPPRLRPRDRAAEAYNNLPSTRPEERVVPRRSRNDYESERARHAPASSSPPTHHHSHHHHHNHTNSSRSRESSSRAVSSVSATPSKRKSSSKAKTAATPAVLAGLTGVSTSSRLAATLAGAGIGGGRSRVNAWRAHVRPGVEPREGVLSM